MTALFPMVKYVHHEKDMFDNIEEVEKFAHFFDKNSVVLFEEKYKTIIVEGSINTVPQQVWNGEYLIFDIHEKIFSVGTIKDVWGWEDIELEK